NQAVLQFAAGVRRREEGIARIEGGAAVDLAAEPHIRKVVPRIQAGVSLEELKLRPVVDGKAIQVAASRQFHRRLIHYSDCVIQGPRFRHEILVVTRTKFERRRQIEAVGMGLAPGGNGRTYHQDGTWQEHSSESHWLSAFALI